MVSFLEKAKVLEYFTIILFDILILTVKEPPPWLWRWLLLTHHLPLLYITVGQKIPEKYISLIFIVINYHSNSRQVVAFIRSK